MSVFSTISIQDRFEIQDILSRFCHALDRNDVRAWQQLFRTDARVCAPRFGTYEGIGAINTIPQLVADHGKGAWRHYLNNIAMTGSSHRQVQVDAYCMVSNWRAGGQIVRSWDLHALFVKAKIWQIAHLNLTVVPGDPTALLPISSAASARPDSESAAMKSED